MNREIHVGLCTPKSRPVDGDERLAEIVERRLARRADLPLGQHDAAPACRPPSLPMADAARAPSRRSPSGGSSAISTSAIIQLVDASQPGNSMPAVLRTRLRPPSQPTRYCARSDVPSDSVDVDAGVVLREAGHLASAIDRHRQLADPVGEDALDALLPQREHVVVPASGSR